MRKSVVLGLLALAFGVFGAPAFAGNVEDCEYLKDKSHEDYAPGLYGLCVAWHNADEDAKDGLADKFFDRAGFEVPGSEDPVSGVEQDFHCPCWSDVTFEDICALGEPIIITPGVQVAFNNGIVFEGFLGMNNSTVCAHSVQLLPNNEYVLDIVIADLSGDEAYYCQAERDIIAALYLDQICD